MRPKAPSLLLLASRPKRWAAAMAGNLRNGDALEMSERRAIALVLDLWVGASTGKAKRGRRRALEEGQDETIYDFMKFANEKLGHPLSKPGSTRKTTAAEYVATVLSKGARKPLKAGAAQKAYERVCARRSNSGDFGDQR